MPPLPRRTPAALAACLIGASLALPVMGARAAATIATRAIGGRQ